MTPRQLINARKALGLSKTEMAHTLKFSGYRAYHALENAETPIKPQIELLVKLLIDINKTEFSDKYI